MNDAEKRQLANEIDSRWPLKFMDADLKYFCERLAIYSLYEVVEALAAHKVSSTFPPKVPEIIARLPKDVSGHDAKRKLLRYKTATARTYAGKRPHVFGEPENVVLLRHYREMFQRYEKDRLAVKRPNAAEIIAADAQRFTRECAIELTHAGIDFERAQELGRIIALEDDAFEQGVCEAATETSTENARA